MIKIKINCSKIQKDKLFRGENGLYLDAVMIETPNSQYGQDYMIVQDVTKEEREKGIKGAILGDAKIIGQKPQAAPKPAAVPASRPTAPAPTESEPF
jgi:hypothetical protein